MNLEPKASIWKLAWARCTACKHEHTGVLYSFAEHLKLSKESLTLICNKYVTNSCEKQSYGKHAYFHESHRHMKSFVLVPNLDLKRFAFLEVK